MPEVSVFSEQNWYTQAVENEEEITGTIRKTPVRGPAVGRMFVYHLETNGKPRYPIYTGGKQEEVFENLVGTEVVVTGKRVTMAIDKTRKEIWPSKVREA